MRPRTLIANSLKLTFVTACCALFTACPKKDQAAPADTLLGERSSPKRPGYIEGNPDGYGPDGRPLDFGPDGATPADIDASLEPRPLGSSVDPDGGIRNLVPSIYFDYDQFNVRADQRSALTETIDYLSANASSTILVEGHCDFKGTTEYNLALGDRRAGSVRDYLIASGIDSSRVSVVSKGDLEAVQDGTDSQRAEDRRADIIIYE